jgi:hypothetical protein
MRRGNGKRTPGAGIDRFVDVSSQYLRYRKASAFVKSIEFMMPIEKPIVIAFRVCDPLDGPGAESASRKESEVWRVEEFLRIPAHQNSQGNTFCD